MFFTVNAQAAHILAARLVITDTWTLACSKLRMCHLSKAEACAFYEVHQGKPFFEKLTTFISSGKIVAMELVTGNAIAKWRQLIGPTNSDTARSEAPDSLRAKFGTDGTQNACHGSDAPDTAAQVRSLTLRVADFHVLKATQAFCIPQLRHHSDLHYMLHNASVHRLTWQWTRPQCCSLL